MAKVTNMHKSVCVVTTLLAGMLFSPQLRAQEANAVICFGDPSMSASSATTTSIPIQAGYYKANGVNVRIQPSQSGSECALAVSSGHAFATSAGMTALLVAAAKDPTLVIVAASYRYSWGVAVPDDSPIKTVAELKGKAIGVQSLSSASYLFGKATVNGGGLNPDTDVQWLNVGLGATAANALQTNRVVGYATYNGVVDIVGHLLGKKMRWLPSQVTLLQGNYGWLVRRADLKEKPQVVAGMLRGAFQASVYGNANPVSGLAMHLKQFPEQANPANRDAAIAILASRAEEQVMTDSTNLIGHVSTAELQKTASFYHKNGLLANEVDVSKIVDLSLIESANKFDKAKIVAAAKAAN